MAKTLSSKMKSLKQEQLKQKAEANTTITKKVGREAPETVKQGLPLDHTTKHNPYANAQFGMSSRPKVGANIGCTLNMDNYESMRIDCWMTDEVQEGESFEMAFARVLNIVQTQVEEVAEQYKLNN